ncbi:hypothetical protein BKA82DRAFT_1003568 [Pisolithus tinctorius]|uniref:Uncharacterized protein n=1 Tax=Pisolithus tinctorius Marx 270 TaxID=870435 RepID=A0A0C3IVL3_PISTI|nr:hypothetical protein BKA82DRAFT_1003568 [Pisolithus tinctorius]KIO00858.1 hypothetical protein M404DRAFT_1003568 [Pisolithus tinctorius Marx 270]
MTTTAKAGTGGGKTIGAPHLTRLREVHRWLGIAKSQGTVVWSGYESSIGRSGTMLVCGGSLV